MSTDPPGATPVAGIEQALLSALDDMLAHPGFLYPLVAAQRQYRDHYYGLSSAALLEDLFYDTFANFLAQYRPTVMFERPGRGQKGWDYRFEGMQVSHKVGLKPQAIAALWDATVKATTWTFDYPVAYLCAGYEPGVGTITVNGATHHAKPLAGRPTEQIGAGHRLWLIDWPVAGDTRVLWTTEATKRTTVGDLLPFTTIWPQIAESMRAGVRANRLEILRSTRPVPHPGQKTLDGGQGELVTVGFTHRAGISLFVAADLIDVPVTSNNRAVLLAKETVALKMASALTRGLFVPMPLWFRVHAADRPPDLYLTQRSEFDTLFSPAQPPSKEAN